jgi:regulator of RNase E activity RraA
VVDGGGDLTQALMGDIMASYAEKIGVVGLVVDGAIRDVGALRQRDFPVYARGVTHRGPYKSGPGEINVAVTVGGMVVMPGDIVVGDEDGVLAIAKADAAAVAALARKQEAREAEALRAIAEGRFDRSWLEPHEKAMMGG